MNRGVFRLGLALAMMALAFVLVHHLLAPPPGVTAANVRRLWPGMPVHEVEAFLGKPGLGVLDSGPGAVIWFGREGMVFVMFDERDMAQDILFVRDSKAEPGLLDRLRSWLGW
jgi:hypothetical protein